MRKNIVQTLITKYKYTGSEIAKIAGVSPSYVSLWKNGLLRVTPKFEIKLKKVLDRKKKAN